MNDEGPPGASKERAPQTSSGIPVVETRARLILPAAIAILAIAIFVLWLRLTSQHLTLRVPGTDRAPGTETAGGNPVLAGKLIPGSGQAASLPGDWSQFRGDDRDGISKEKIKFLRQWPPGGPKKLWEIEMGEGYAGAAVRNGRVYLMDYDQAKKQDALRCLSLAEGKEIWRFAYPISVKRNHGMSRTVPATTENRVVAMGPKCDVVCADAISGELRWGLDLVKEFGATVPPWYAGQCPLIESNAVILAPGGKDALLTAVDLETGKPVWRSPNPRHWKMTHSSIMPAEFDSQRMYLYCADNGVAAVSAKDGSILWDTSEWKISIATVPSPLVIPGNRIFLSGGYNAGSMMLQLHKADKGFVAQTLFRLGPEVFGATQHTPIFYQNHIYGARADGKFVCLDLSGTVVWTSESGQQFGLGSFIVADGLIFAMNDSGLLRLIDGGVDGYHLLSQAQILTGRESWGPLAMAGGRLLARDFTHLACFQAQE